MSIDGLPSCAHLSPAYQKRRKQALSTGNYLPRHSQIASDGEKLTLKPRAQEMVDRFILPSIEAGLKTLIVAPKAFQEIEAVRSLQCELINHHHAEGRNDYQDRDVVFVFHYEPNHHAILDIAKRLYRNVEHPLDFTREKRAVTVGGVSFLKNGYFDERVQAVYNRECRQRLMQAAMRLRPNIHEGKIIVFLTAEPIDLPVTPVAFSLTDGDGFTGHWQQFHEKLQEQDTEIDVTEVSEREGVSRRTAERRTKAARQQSKADRDVEICNRYYRLKQRQQDIADALGIGLATVNRVLKRQPF